MNNNTTKNFKNMKKCKSLRTLIVAGSLALLSIVNVSILTMRDTRVKSQRSGGEARRQANRKLPKSCDCFCAFAQS